MKKLFFAIGVITSTFSFSQEQISVIKLTFESCYGFTAVSVANNVNSSFAIQNDSTYIVDRVVSGYNNTIIDLKNKTFENNSVANCRIYRSVSKIENVQIKNDTLTFYINTTSRITMQSYTEYFTIVLHPKENSTFLINIWADTNSVFGTYLDTSYAHMIVE
jgi:hypothetical protein